jgi:hypothetical protein
MKIFISWSGELSQKIGETIKDWLPAVLQSVKPYFTPSDIEKGSRWSADIAKELEQSKIGIFIFTKENLDSQWMIFEAGAISKSLDASKVCPILFGIDNSDFKGPLTQFQTSQFSKVDIRKLLRTINNNLGEQKLDDKVLDEVFDMWYPRLETKILKILEDYNVENRSIRDDRELLEEILGIVRITAKRTIPVGRIKPSINYDVRKFEHLVNAFIGSTILLFDMDWEHTKSCFGDHIIDCFISKNHSFLSPGVVDEGNDWGNRPAFLNSYRALKYFMEENGIINLSDLDNEDLPF